MQPAPTIEKSKSDKVNPEWVTGFCDRSAHFGLQFTLRNPATDRWEIKPEFRILANVRYKNVLGYMKGYFGVGTISHTGKNVVYRVGSVKDLVSVIIPHFEKYPLLSTKVCTFILWAKAINMMSSGDHKTKDGFWSILSIYAGINKGASTAVKTHFPELKPALLPSYSLDISPNELSQWWISGYFSIYCNFNVQLDPHTLRVSYYDRVVPSFNFSRNIKELPLISLLASYFEVTAHPRSDGSRADVNIYSIKSCIEVVNLFESFPLLSCKQYEFSVWAKIVQDKEKLKVKSTKTSLSLYMKHFLDLDLELDRIRKRNNS